MLKVLLNDPSANTSSILRHYSDKVMPLFSGLEIKCNNVYNICPGKVVAVGKENDGNYAISLLVNNRQMIRYVGIVHCYVQPGDILGMRDALGDCNKSIRLEYCTVDKLGSIWPVRIKQLLMYKHNPEGLLNGSTKLSIYFNTDTTGTEVTDSLGYPTDSLSELSNNRGE